MPTEATTDVTISMVDLIFDTVDSGISNNQSNSTSIFLATNDVNTIKPSSESYFDLIGLNKSNSQYSINKQQHQQSSTSGVTLGFGLDNLLEGGGGDDSSSIRSVSPYKDDLLDSMLGDLPPLPVLPILPTLPALSSLPLAHPAQSKQQNQSSHPTSPLQPPTSLSLSQVIQVEKPEVKQPELPPPSSTLTTGTIDILITEPANEKDDDNIVPDGYFNMKHEAPKDQSRPHSPDIFATLTIASNNAETTIDNNVAAAVVVNSTSAVVAPKITSYRQTFTYNPSMSRARPRPVSPRAPSPPLRTSRPTSPGVASRLPPNASIPEQEDIAAMFMGEDTNEMSQLEKTMNSILDAGASSTDNTGTLGKKNKTNKVS